MITLTERLKSSLNQQINESFGQFPGLSNIAEFCANEIFMACNGEFVKPNETYTLAFNRNDFDCIDKVFFKEVEFNIKFVKASDTRAAYMPSAKIDKRTMRFKKVEINLYLSYEKEINAKELWRDLMHELTHAYTDYKLKLKGIDYFNQLGEFYSKVEYDPNAPDIQNQIRQALYLTLGVEKQAFLAQFDAEIELSEKQIKTPADAMEILRNTEVYSFYADLKAFIDEYFNDNLEEEAIELITSEYNRISNTNYQPVKVFKKLKFLIDKAIEKFDKVIEKLCLDRFS